MDSHDLTDPPSPVLVIVAHPDDIDFGMSGTVAALTTAGAEVVYCLVTSGEAGAPDDLSRQEVGCLREHEQRAAAAEVGVIDVRFLGYPDGAVEATLQLRRDISRVIRDVKPALLLSPSPERRYDRIFASHPDHLATAAAVFAAAYPDAQNPHAHPTLIAEGYEPHNVTEMWVTGLDPADIFIDITHVFDRKVRALGAHTSQTAEMDRDKLLREWASGVAIALGFPQGTLVEAFRRVAVG